MAIPKELQERLVACVRQYRTEHGQKELLPGTLLVELEDAACEIGDAVSGGMLEAALREHAAASEETACCPRCRRPGKRNAEPEPRILQTRRGEVGWNEPTYYCRHCRQAFFPSEPRLGRRSGGLAQSRRA
jgi:hypothetical protein